MLKKIHIQRYKSLFDVTVDLEPLTVFIGPNGSGKSSICESIYFLSNVIDWLEQQTGKSDVSIPIQTVREIVRKSFGTENTQSKFWHGSADPFRFEFTVRGGNNSEINKTIILPSEFVELPIERAIANTLSRTQIFDFSPKLISHTDSSTTHFQSSGNGIAYQLADILLNDRKRFAELETQFTQLIPNIERIVLERHPQTNQFSLYLKDRFSDFNIPSSDVSDGTLRILAFLTVLYQLDSPKVICFEEPENGIHPWLLNKIIELLTIVSTSGIRGTPVQILITTHSLTMLDLLMPEQIRTVEMDKDGKTHVHPLPVSNARFKEALASFDGDLGELWFTNIFGGNPQ